MNYWQWIINEWIIDFIGVEVLRKCLLLLFIKDKVELSGLLPLTAAAAVVTLLVANNKVGYTVWDCVSENTVGYSGL